MAYNGAGLFNLYSPGNPVVTGTTITSTWANNTLSDIATGLSTCITKDGQTAVTHAIPMAGYRITDVGDATLAGDALNKGQFDRPVFYIENYGANPETGTGFTAALNDALADMATLQTGQAGLVGGLVTTYTPAVKWIATGPIVYPGINYQQVIINGSIDATALANGTTLLELSMSYCAFECNGGIYGPGTGASNADLLSVSTGSANKISINEAENFRYGVHFPNTGGGAVVSTENTFEYRVWRQMRRHVYAPSPGGTTQFYEGTRFVGGLLLNAILGCVRIEPNVNMNFSRISGGIDSGGAGIEDYENLSTTSGVTLDLDYIHDPSYYTLGINDSLFNGPVNGFDFTAATNAAPGVRIRQTTPYTIPASMGNATSFIYSGDGANSTTMQGALTGNTYSFSASNSVSLFSGYVSGAGATSTSAAFSTALHRTNNDATANIGAGAYYTKRASADKFDVQWKWGGFGGTLMGKIYYEGDRLNLPNTYTPSSAADSYGATGDQTWDATKIYQKTASGWRGVATLPVGKINEIVESSATGVTISTTNTYQDVTSISLTAGTWVIDGLVNFEINTATCTAAVMGVSTTSGNSAAGLVNGSNKMGCREPTADTNSSATVAGYVVSPAGTTSYYLKALNTFSAGNPIASGRITARRIA